MVTESCTSMFINVILHLSAFVLCFCFLDLYFSTSVKREILLVGNFFCLYFAIWTPPSKSQIMLTMTLVKLFLSTRFPFCVRTTLLNFGMSYM